MSAQPSYLEPVPARRRIRYYTLTELYARSRDPFRVEGLIHATLTGIVGPPYVGKSALGANLIDSGLCRRDFLGGAWDTPPDRMVLVATDSGALDEYKDRFRALGLEDDGRLTVAQDTPVCAAEWAELRIDNRLTPESVVIIDNLTHFVTDTNSAKEVRGFFDAVEGELCRWGIAVVLLAHKSEKSGPWGPPKTPMGTTAISANLRHVIYVDKAGDGLRLLTEGNDCAEPLTIYLSRGDHAADFAVSSVEATKADTERRKAKRSKETMDRNARMADFVVSDCC